MPETDYKITTGPVDTRRSLFFGRRQGRPIRKERTEALQTILPQIGIEESLLSENHTTPPEQFFGKNVPSVWLEIGFGYGEHIATLCRRHPNIGYLGAEPYINGMATLLKDIGKDTDKGLPGNLRVLMDDGVRIARSLTPASLDGLYILNPDPWHKKRHHKRRIVRRETLDIFAHILKPGGQLIMSTDVEDLAEWMCTHTCTHPAFTWLANSAADWQTPPADWVPTRYETKGAKGAKKMVYLMFKRTQICPSDRPVPQ